MIVLDASAAYLGLTHHGEAQRRMSTEAIAAPHHIDPELLSTLRAECRRDALSTDDARATIAVWHAFGIRREPVTGLLDRIWELRDNLTAYDAGYVALAEALDCDLVTADARLARAPGPRCSITVVKT